MGPQDAECFGLGCLQLLLQIAQKLERNCRLPVRHANEEDRDLANVRLKYFKQAPRRVEEQGRGQADEYFRGLQVKRKQVPEVEQINAVEKNIRTEHQLKLAVHVSCCLGGVLLVVGDKGCMTPCNRAM